jgi:putative thiamine transport system permease protein
VLLSLEGPYNGFDARLQQVAATLGRSRWTFLLHVKWPMLRSELAAGGQRSLASAFAWLQWLLTVLVFGIAGWWGRAQWLHRPHDA